MAHPSNSAPALPSVPADLASSGARWTAADHVHNILQGMVISGELAPGGRVTEIALAERLNVSRTPLRQALGKLESNGWLRRAPNGAIHVADVSARELDALYAVRLVLEEMVVVEAAAAPSRRGLQELGDLLQLQDQAVARADSARVAELGEAFHRALWRQSENSVTIAFLEQVLERTMRYRRLSFATARRFEEGNRQHWELVRAIEGADGRRARDLIHRHVSQSREYALAAFEGWHRTHRGAPAA